MTLLPRLKSLQARLLALLLMMMALVWLAAAVLTWIGTRHELDELLDGHLAQSAALLVAQQTIQDQDQDDNQKSDPPGRHDDDAQPLHKYAPRVAFQVFHEGQLTLRSANVGDTPMSTTLRGFETVQLPDQSRWRVFATQGNEGDVQVFVGERTESRHDILWAVMTGVLTPLLYSLPLLGLVGWLAVRQALAALRQLSRLLAKRQPQALDAVVLGDLPAEIEPVVQSLNALFGRIGNMLSSERRFTADAAHELRTPIAAIRIQAQVALGAGGDIAERDHALRLTIEGCDRAAHLVEQLLTLSRLEASSASAPAGLVNLSALAQRVAADLAPTALQNGQVLELEASVTGLIQVDDTLTCVLLRNLTDNALRYSPPGAKVCLSVTTEDNRVLLQVDDSGPGLPDVDMARLGERFFRCMGTAQSGSGLGWSIVRRIAAVYQAEVKVCRSTLLGGLCVSVIWPVHAAQPVSNGVIDGGRRHL